MICLFRCIPTTNLPPNATTSFGKTEMWYVLDAEQDAYLIIGFNEDTEKNNYVAAVESGDVENLLQKVPKCAPVTCFYPCRIGTCHWQRGDGG